MRWPVLLTTHLRSTRWSLGERVSTRLRWLDQPDLPDDLMLHRIVARAGTLHNAVRQPWAQLVEAGGLLALREGDHRAGEIMLDGCLGFDAFLGLVGELPDTVGTVRRIRVLHDLHDRGRDGWVRRAGGPRLTDVPDAGPERLRDDPSSIAPKDPCRESDLDSMQFLSTEQYFELTGDRLPARQWQARGFLVDLDIVEPGAS